MSGVFDVQDTVAFRDAVAALDEFRRAGRPQILTQNFGVAVAVLLHRAVAGAAGGERVLTGPGGGPPTTTPDLERICDRTWHKDDPFRPAGVEGPIFKPFTTSFKDPSGNNWRNSFDLQGGLGCDAPYDDDFLRREDYLGEPRFDCAFREPLTGHCLSPAGLSDRDRTCFNPAKHSAAAPAPGPGSRAQHRPKLLTRGYDADGAPGYWYVEPTVDVLADLLGRSRQRVPLLPFLVALYAGSPYWSARGHEISRERLEADLVIGPERFLTLFDPDPEARHNLALAARARTARRRRRPGPERPAPPPPAPDGGPLSDPVPFRPRDPADLVSRAGAEIDPERRHRLLQRANAGHRRTLNALAGQLAAAGYGLDEQLDGYDLRAAGDGDHLFEVKTWTPANLAKQVRTGWAQLYEYRDRNEAGLRPPVALYLVLDRVPPADLWMWPWLADRLGVLPCWLADGRVTTFPEYAGRLPPGL